MKKILILLILFILFTLASYSVDVVDIIRKLDNNEVFNTIRYKGELEIVLSGKRIVKTFDSYAKGRFNYFIEFTNQDDIGTKYLKKDGKLYYYSDDTEKIIPITGHMLRESMMGSDFSYEDAIENETLESQYNARIIGEGKFEEETKFKNKDVWILELIAKTKTISYPKQVIWVDKETVVALKVERYALSGAKLKEYILLDAKWINGKFFPVEMQIRDLLRKNSKTILRMKEVELDIPISDEMFSMKKLLK